MLLTLQGCGQLSAAKLVGETAGIGRFSRGAQFARHNGTAPVPVWSGNAVRHRLSRGGNRQLNVVLHRIAITQIRLGGRGRAYFEPAWPPATRRPRRSAPSDGGSATRCSAGCATTRPCEPHSRAPCRPRLDIGATDGICCEPTCTTTSSTRVGPTSGCVEYRRNGPTRWTRGWSPGYRRRRRRADGARHRGGRRCRPPCPAGRRRSLGRGRGRLRPVHRRRRTEAERRGPPTAMTYPEGDAVGPGGRHRPGDLVALDRVVCCIRTWSALVGVAAERTRRRLGDRAARVTTPRSGPGCQQ